MGLTTTVHYVKDIQIKPVETKTESYWRRIIVKFATHEDETMVFELCMFGDNAEDLKINATFSEISEIQL